MDALSTTLNPAVHITGDIPAKQTNADFKKVAKEYESVYLTEMLGYMWQGIKTDGLMNGGNSEEVFRSMLLKQYSDKIADSGKLGISDALQKELIRLQEKH